MNRVASLTCLALGLLAGCAAPQPPPVRDGDYGAARMRLQQEIEQDRGDRDYILSRTRLGVMTLADGLPEVAEPTLFEVYQLLRTQGLNEDKTVSSVLINEDLKIWKGEPFEQAMTYHYVAVQYAAMGQWDNARAAAASSLFLLKNFGDRPDGSRKNTEDIARQSVETNDDGYFDSGYVATDTNFALGYFMNAAANTAIGREAEAADNFRKAAALVPGLEPIGRHLMDGDVNTLLVVDYGPGPRKVAYGPDGALARFQPMEGSDQRPLDVMIDGVPTLSVPPACDVNAMATDHMWNNLEDVRIAKAVLGRVLLTSGLMVAAYSNDSKAQTAGLIAAGIGLIARAGAHADTRYCEAMPQRVYVAALQIDEPGTTIDVAVAGGRRLALAGVDPPSNGSLQLRYARIPSLPSATGWTGSGAILYANDGSLVRAAGDDLPYVFGGRCVRRPSPETLALYQAAGYLEGMTVVELEAIYRSEGIALDPGDHGWKHQHILEGGRSLACPQAGSTGFARLFGQLHPPYLARTSEVKSLQEACAAVRATSRNEQEEGPE